MGSYVGNRRFIEAPRTGEDARIDSLSDPYLAEQYVGARRCSAGAIGDPSTYARPLATVQP